MTAKGLVRKERYQWHLIKSFGARSKEIPAKQKVKEKRKSSNMSKEATEQKDKEKKEMDEAKVKKVL